MINKTSSIEFKKYGSTYEEHMSIKDNNLIIKMKKQITLFRKRCLTKC